MALDLLAAAAAAPAAPLHAPVRNRARLSELQRYSIVALNNDGRTQQYIANALQVGERTVRHVLSRFRQFGNSLQPRALREQNSSSSQSECVGLLLRCRAGLSACLL